MNGASLRVAPFFLEIGAVSKIGTLLFLCALSSIAVMPGYAQILPSVPSAAGALVIVPAYGEVTQANDQAHATFMLEEQNKDKATAASLVNKGMKRGTDLIRKADPAAVLKSRGYYTYPVYADEASRTQSTNKTRQPIGWRVGQYLDVTTSDLAGLAKMVATAQSVVVLNGLQFGLADATQKKLDQKRIEATYRNLVERIAAIANAMGRPVSDAVIDTIDFEGSGAYAPPAAAPKMMMRASAAMESAAVEEPSFEPGETTLNMRLVGKIKFK